MPVHFVWTTKRRFEWISPEWEPRVYSCICTQCAKMRCEVLAIGGMPDHVHLAVLFGTNISVGQFMKHVKGATSHLIHEVLAEENPFYWQEGYGAFGFQIALAPKVVKYIENQKCHHAEGGSLWPALEATTIEMNQPVRQDVRRRSRLQRVTSVTRNYSGQTTLTNQTNTEL